MVLKALLMDRGDWSFKGMLSCSRLMQIHMLSSLLAIRQIVFPKPFASCN